MIGELFAGGTELPAGLLLLFLTLAGDKQSRPVCRTPYPSPGDCRFTYADLVQSPLPRRVVRRKKSEAARSGSRSSSSGADTDGDLRQRPRAAMEFGGDECAVCGRRHGDMSGLAPEGPLGHGDEDNEPSDSTGHADRNKVRLRQKNETQRLYREDCQVAMRKAIAVALAVYGEDASHLQILRQHLCMMESSM